MEKYLKNIRIVFLLALIGIAFIIWYAVFFYESRQNLIVTFFDIGQGEAALIEIPGRKQILIDGGPDGKILAELAKVMPFYDRSLDVVIATHPDQDHIGGLADVLERFDVGFVIEPGIRATTAVYENFENLIAGKGIKKILARRGMKLVLDNGAYLSVLFPDRDIAGLDTNAASIVAKLVYGDTSFLFTGDSPQAIERYLISTDKKNLDADVLKAGHHGSKTSTSHDFLAAVSPQFAVIQSGKRNRYGHPHQEVLDRLQSAGITILRNDLMGAIQFWSDGTRLAETRF